MAELCHRYRLKAVIDMGASDGTLAHFCATSKPPIPYLGFTLSDLHTTLLETTMATEGPGIYDPESAKLLGPQMTKDETGKTTNPEAKPPKQESESETPKKQETKTTSGTKGSAKTESASEMLDSFTRNIEEIKKKRARTDQGEEHADSDE